jgi:hypothetical protein
MDDKLKNWLESLTATYFMIEHIEPMKNALNKLYREGDENPDAAQMWEAISWIINHQEKSAVERLAMINKLCEQEGRVIVDMEEFTGW